VQVLGAIVGVLAAHLMFEENLLQISSKLRSGPAQWFSEWVAAFGLGRDRSPYPQGQSSSGGDIGWSLHYRCLLVHRLHIVCQSGRDNRSGALQYLCRYPPNGCSSLHCRPDVGSSLRALCLPPSCLRLGRTPQPTLSGRIACEAFLASRKTLAKTGSDQCAAVLSLQFPIGFRGACKGDAGSRCTSFKH
jgi:hypothetical protein